MEKCPLCGGDKKEGHTTYSVDLGFGVVVVRDVPAKVCSQCGEEWIDAQFGKFNLGEIKFDLSSYDFELLVLAYELSAMSYRGLRGSDVGL